MAFCGTIGANFISPREAGIDAPRARVSVADLLSRPKELIAWLESHNGDVRAAAQRIRQAQADVGTARLPANPSLNVSLSDITIGTTNPPRLPFSQTAVYGGTLAQTLEIGKRGPRIASAGLKLDSTREAYLDLVGDTVTDARAALGRVAHLRRRQAALEESLAGARQILDLQRSRLDNGDLAGNEYDRLLVDTMVLETDVALSRAEYAAAQANCRALLVAECDAANADLALFDAAAEAPEALPAAEEYLARRHDIRALEQAAASAGLDAVLARRRIIPDPSLAVGYTRDLLTISGDQPRTLQIGVGIALPVFDRGQHDAARSEAHAAELRESAAALRERARREVEALRERRRELDHVLGGLKAEALPRSKRVLDSTLAALGQGELSMTDLLLARRTHTDVVLKVMDLEFAAFAAANELRHALGLDGELARQAGGL
jgi:outer membrane protein, heavy metal efflux system